MKITIVTGAFLPVPPGPAGAVEKIWSRLAQEFARRGHSVTLVSRKYEGAPQEEVQSGVRNIRRSGFACTGYRGVDKTLDLIYTLFVLGSLPKSDITVTNTFFLPILTGPLARYCGQTVVDMQRFPKGQLPLYSRAKRVRVPSRAVFQAAALQHFPSRAVLKTIPNPVDLETFTPPMSPRPPAAQGTILFTGRIHPEKGLHLLIRAFRIINSEFPTVGLRLVGPQDTGVGGGGAKYIRELNKLAEGLPVEMHPLIRDPKELAIVLQNASIFCYPSLAEKGESFGVAPLEAMATGLPVVVSNLAVFRDFIEDGETGLVFDHRACRPEQELASKLRTLVLDDQLRNMIAWKASLRALQFGYDLIAEEFLNDFSSLTQSNTFKR